MKKFLLTIAMLSSVAVMAQDKPLNPGFEDWEGVPLVDEAPEFYITTGQLLEAFLGAPVPGDWVTKSTTSKAEGLYSIKLTTDSVQGFGNIPGLIFSNTYETIDAQNFFAQLGFPFTDTLKRPVALKGSYRSEVMPDDTVSLTAIATYYDQDSEERVFIGFGEWIATTTQATFQNFTMPIEYEFDLMPDTIVIIGASGPFEGDAEFGTSLWLDNFSYTLAEIGDTTDTSTSIRNTILASASVYPNPTVDVVNVKMNETVSPNAVVTVFDAIGRKTYNRSYIVSNNEIRFNVADLMNGYYIINIVGKMYTKSFLKK
jgi:hypothetical protein